MAKAIEVKYPNSAKLFSFCKSILDIKFGNLRVIDQDVGQILKFDPAECSHWKKGRKNIRSFDSIHIIATHLGLDERLVMDVASGALTDVEALIEYRGVGAFHVPASIPETIRGDWQRNQGKTWTLELEQKTKAFFSINHPALQKVVDEIHERIGFQEAPLFLPEIMNAYPNLKFSQRLFKDHQISNSVDLLPIGRPMPDGTFEIQCGEGSQMRPVIRFHVAKAMAPFFISDLLDPVHIAFKDHVDLMKNIYANTFAAWLLMPAKLVRREMSRINLSHDIVTQLAEAFWVSRSLMNLRLRDILAE